eukprot:4511999-Pyramimonas_sp.AAC.1
MGRGGQGVACLEFTIPGCSELTIWCCGAGVRTIPGGNQVRPGVLLGAEGSRLPLLVPCLGDRSCSHQEVSSQTYILQRYLNKEQTCTHPTGYNLLLRGRGIRKETPALSRDGLPNRRHIHMMTDLTSIRFAPARHLAYI